MKFCKDCKHYSAGISAHGGTLLPGFVIVTPDACHGSPETTFNLVTGARSSYAGECKDVRADGSKCGTSAVWFKPANLDGRLAALEKA